MIFKENLKAWKFNYILKLVKLHLHSFYYLWLAEPIGVPWQCSFSCPGGTRNPWGMQILLVDRDQEPLKVYTVKMLN